MNVTALYRDYNDRSGEQRFNQNTIVAASLLYVVQHYFINWSSYFVLTLSCRRNHACSFYNDMFQKMFNKWQEWPLQIVIVERNESKIVPGLRQFNMIMADSYEAFLDTKIHSYTSDYNTNENYFIFLQCPDALMQEQMQHIFEYCWRHYLINCIVQVQTKNGSILHYTYYPFTAQHCDKVTTVLVNEYNGSSLVNEDLFPNKLKNFYGCSLRAAVWDVPPYLFLSTDSNNTKYISGGFEGKLLLELANKLNFSLEIIEPPNNSKRGVVMENGTLTGALKLLQERSAHLSLGSFRQTLGRTQAMTPTINYFQTIWTVVTRSDAYNLSSLEILLFPFSHNTWYFLILLYSLSLFAINLAKHIMPKIPQKNFKAINLAFILIVLGMPTQYEATSDSGRIVNATFLWFSLILRTIYHALLFHLIRTQVTRNLPKALEELIYKNYSMIVNDQSYDALNEIPIFQSLNYIQLNTSLEMLPFSYFEHLPFSKASHTALAVPYVFYQYYIQSENKDGVFTILPQNIMNFKVCMFVSKHSFLVDQINDVLKMMRSSGLVYSWYRQAINADYFKSRHFIRNHIFGLDQLKMMFVILFIGAILATSVFLLEIICSNIKKRKGLKNKVKF